ncbi:deoxyguanosinetriphosphate triphosphohydrolase family protein, partial [Thomasclavelia cocleata]
LQAKGYGYFAHNANSVRNILFLERNGIGYNVSLQVLDAILCHNGEMLSKKYIPDTNKTINQFWREYDDCWHKENTSKKILPMTLEGCVVRISDVISYIGKDVEDAIRVGIIKQSDLPKEVTDILGFNNKSMINRLIGDLVIHSYELPYLQFSNEVFESLKCLLNFLTIKVHQHPVLVKENAKLIRMIKQLYDIYYEELTDFEHENCKIKTFVAKMSSTYQSNDPALIVADYLSMMTDSYVLAEYESIFLPIQHNEII